MSQLFKAPSPNTSELNINYLREMYAQDSTAVNQLQSLLLVERELMEQRKHEGLQEIVMQKDQLLETLTFNAKQREQLLRAADLETTLAGWEQFLTRSPLTQPLISQWQALTGDFLQCQKANEINGRMISRSRQTLTNLLNLIRGQVAMPSLYTQKGATTNQNSSHTVVKA
ncbi:MAG: flagellar protein FlgN [Pseudomonadota bacterium]